MAQKNIVNPLPTPHMTAEAAGKIYAIKEGNGDYRCSLESALTDNGWRSIANDLKLLLLNIQQGTRDSRTSLPDDAAEAEMDKLFSAILEVAEVDGSEARASLKQSLYRSLVWESEHNSFSFTAPEVEGTSTLIKDSIDKAFFHTTSNLTSKEDNTKYRYYKRHLFASEPSEESREIILQFAYLLKMTGEDAHIYLTKWSFSDGIRWDSPWELAAAYEIACNPARQEDRASDFLDAIHHHLELNRRNPKAPENQPFLTFLEDKEMQEYGNWAESLASHRHRGLEDAFLAHWAWLLQVSRAPAPESKIVPKLSKEVLRRDLPQTFGQLKAFAQTYISPEGAGSDPQSRIRIPEDLALRQEIISVMKNRHLRLLAAAYAYAHMSYGTAEHSVDLPWQSSTPYTVPHRDLGFDGLPDYAYKLEFRYKEVKKDKIKDTGKPRNRPTRSDVISLGLELALTRDGIGHLLSIGGFYPMLYSRDFYEHALLRVLYEMEAELPHDGFRFAITSHFPAREDDATDMASQKIKEQFLLCLEENYEQIGQQHRSECMKSEPNWIKRALRRKEKVWQRRKE